MHVRLTLKSRMYMIKDTKKREEKKEETKYETEKYN